MTVKKGALLSTIATTLSTLWSFWTSFLSFRSITLMHPSWKWWFAPLTVVLGLLDAALPFFYWALYRFEGRLKLPKWSRTLAGLVACATGAVLCAQARDLAKSGIFPTTAACLNLFAELSCAVLLFGLYREPAEEDLPAQTGSAAFPAFTKAAGLWGGSSMALYGFQFVARPLVFAVVRHIALENGRPSPHFIDLLLQRLRSWSTCSHFGSRRGCFTKFVDRRAEQSPALSNRRSRLTLAMHKLIAPYALLKTLSTLLVIVSKSERRKPRRALVSLMTLPPFTSTLPSRPTVFALP